MPSLTDRSRSHATGVRERLRQSLFTGLAITVPLLITLLVVSLVAGFVFGSLDPLVEIFERILGADSGVPQIVLEMLAVVLVFLAIIVVGFAAESRPSDGHLEDRFDQAMGNIPGIGSVYRTFDEMSEMVMDADTESFQEVKLVEFPTSNSYAIGFVTSEAAEKIERPTGNEDMLALYVPMSPNPVMGGYVIYVPTDRCVDVDMSVEEGIKSIMTSGVSVGEDANDGAAGDVLVDSGDPSVERPTTGKRRAESTDKDGGDP
ncbi:DUF502 domain-containing protein [Halorhabdus rudnickae]|uniref:DUF502 domain-containing protein n=1 Tax=Halorhabdus rudnickae TaxID=1775544 RepID=UPI00108477B3|nr:DUF502 domain-containing protein [Halorhabdus rudnickae]